MQRSMDNSDVLQRRKVTVSYTQSCLQPLQANMQPTFQQNIFIQPQKSMMELGKIKVYFRPTIQMGQDTLPDLSRKLFLGISPIDAESFWTCQSILINGNQLMSQSQSALQRTRTNFMGVYNQLTNKQKNKTTSDYGCNNTGIAFGGGFGSQLQGFQKICANHPYTGGVNGTPATAAQWLSKTEGIEQSVVPATGVLTPTGLYYPRALVSRHKVINTDFIMPGTQTSGTAFQTSNIGSVYYGALLSPMGDAYIANSIMAGGVGGIGANVSPYGNLPVMVNSLTPSVNVYMAQQERFEFFRRRFLTQSVVAITCPFSNAQQFNATPVVNPGDLDVVNAELQEAVCVPIGSNSVSLAMGSVNPATTTIGSSSQRSLVTQNSFAAGSGTGGTSSTFYYQPSEDYTMCEVELRRLSPELDAIGEICLENKQIQIQLQLNLAQNVLSSFLQPSLLVGGATASYAGTYPSAIQNSIRDGPSGTGNAVYQTFLNAATLGSATYVVNDILVRLETIQYDDSAYELAKSVCEAPKPYLSLRQQLDPIPISSQGTFAQRLAIQNPIVLGFMVFFVPTNNNKASNVAINGATVSTYPVATDTMVNYQGCNPCTDLRSTVYDSYRMNMTSYYIDAGDGRRYESNDPPIGNVAYTTYLRTKDALQTAMNRYVDGINFPEWTMNRSFAFIPFNVNADPALAITSSQVVLNMQFDLSDRVQNSQYYQESNLSCTNQWSALTFAITVQSLAGDIIRI